MIKCECYPNHQCCKHYHTCELWIPTNDTYTSLIRELNAELKQLEFLKQRKNDYWRVLQEINDQKYTEIILVNGEEVKVPKLNALGEYILRPEHVQVGLNYNSISQEIKDTESIIRELRREEHNILKILKKRADKYD